MRFTEARLVADLCCGIGGNLVALAAPRTPDRAAEGAPDRAGSDYSMITDSSVQIPRKVIHDDERLVVGIDADPRVREYSLPREHARMQSVGRPGSLLAKTLIISNDRPGRTTVILVPEKLGF